MVSLFFILFVALTIFSASRIHCEAENSPEEEEFTIALTVLMALIAFVFLVWIFLLINAIGTGHTIDSKIKMYEEENESIESSIDTAVNRYMDYESSTYEKIRDKDLISLVSLIPDLKADTLVQKQIEVYLSNNDKLRKLKEEKIDLSKKKWKLYFGR